MHPGGGDLDVPQRDTDHVGTVLPHLGPQQIVRIAALAMDVDVKDLDLVLIGKMSGEVAQTDRPNELEFESSKGLDEEDAHVALFSDRET